MKILFFFAQQSVGNSSVQTQGDEWRRKECSPVISTTPSLVFTTSSSGEKWLTSRDTFQLSWVCLISDMPLLIWRDRARACWAITAPGYIAVVWGIMGPWGVMGPWGIMGPWVIVGPWGIMRPMSGARMEGRRYPGQCGLGNVVKSSGMAGRPKDWSKMRLCWCQSRNGSQLGLRSRVKGIRLSVMAAVFRRQRSVSGCRWRALWPRWKCIPCLSAECFYTHWQHPYQQSPPFCLKPPSSHPQHIYGKD